MGIQVVRRVGSFTVHRLNRAETLINGNRRISQPTLKRFYRTMTGIPMLSVNIVTPTIRHTNGL